MKLNKFKQNTKFDQNVIKEQFSKLIKRLDLRHGVKYKCVECVRLWNSETAALKHIEENHLEVELDLETFGDIDYGITGKSSPKKKKLSKSKTVALKKPKVSSKGSEGKALKDKEVTNYSTKDETTRQLLRDFCKEISKENDRKWFQCKLCSKRINNVTKFKYHMKLVHTDCRDFICGLCQKGFVERCELKRHIVGTHSKDVGNLEIEEVMEKYTVLGDGDINIFEKLREQIGGMKASSKEGNVVKTNKTKVVNVTPAPGTITIPSKHQEFLDKMCTVETGPSGKNVYVCKICSESCGTIERLKNHVKNSHTKDFTCTFCQMLYHDR